MIARSGNLRSETTSSHPPSPPTERHPLPRFVTGARRDECRDTTGPTTTTLELWEMESEVSLENEQQFWDGQCLAFCSPRSLLDSSVLSRGLCWNSIFAAHSLFSCYLANAVRCAELQEIVSAPCSSEDLIDNALRSYLNLATKYKGAIILSAWTGGEGSGCVGLWNIRLTAARVTTDEYLQSELAVSRCSYKLLSSTVFADHADYVRRQMIYGLLQVRVSLFGTRSRAF